MYWEFAGRHHTPHFHAIYGEYEASIAIDPIAVLDGWLPARVLGYVVEWALLHQTELEENWDRVAKRQPLAPIEPLA